jgi:hypothetical protein
MASTAVSKYRTAVKVATAAGSAKTLTAITKASSAVCSSAAHGLTVGTVGIFTSATGMPEIDGRVGIVTAQDTGTFTVNIDSSGFSAAATGGTFTPQTMTLVENALDFQRQGEEADRIESTNLQSTKKEYIVGLSGEGSVTVPVDIDVTGPGQASVRSKVGTDVAQAVTVTRSDGKTSAQMVKWTNFTEAYPDKHTGSFTGTITGAVSWYA